MTDLTKFALSQTHGSSLGVGVVDRHGGGRFPADRRAGHVHRQTYRHQLLNAAAEPARFGITAP